MTYQEKLDKFKREHGIKTFFWGGRWHSYVSAPLTYEDEKTELESVRSLCKRIGILCDL